MKCPQDTLRGWFEKSVRSQRVGTTGAYRLFSVSSISWRNTHQVSAKSVYYSVFGVRLNRKSRVISKKWTKENFVC